MPADTPPSSYLVPATVIPGCRPARRATESGQRGLIVVHTGDGKGKTTAALGLVTRMLSHGGRCAVVQFIKERRDSATRLLRHPRLHWHCAGGGFTWAADPAALRTACETGWQLAVACLRDPGFDLVLLDELNIVLTAGYLEPEPVLAALAARPPTQHVAITGRDALPELVAAADLVTEMRLVKHPFARGVPAQAGIEF